jgi:hypothetical protein
MGKGNNSNENKMMLSESSKDEFRVKDGTTIWLNTKCLVPTSILFLFVLIEALLWGFRVVFKSRELTLTFTKLILVGCECHVKSATIIIFKFYFK